MSTGPYVGAPPRIPDRPLWPPRRARWQENDGAVGVALVGVVMIAVALSLYGSPVYMDEADACASLAAAGADPGVCDAIRAPRAGSVRMTGIVAAVLLVVARLSARRRWVHLEQDLPASWAIPVWALLPAVWVPASLAGIASGFSLVRVGPVAVVSGILVAWWGASLMRDAAARAHLLAAVATAVPLVGAGIAIATALRFRDPSRPWQDQDASFPLPVGVWPFLVTLAGTAVLFSVAVGLAKHQRPAPNIWVGGGLFALSTVVTVVVFVPDLVPGWRGGYEALPGTTTWLPLLLAPAVLTALVWVICATRRRPEPAST